MSDLIKLGIVAAIVWFTWATDAPGADRVNVHEYPIGTKFRNCTVVRDHWPGTRTLWVCEVKS